MPIQFRCAYCNQLLGIARRKAGTTVNCPTCGKQIVVPTPEPNQAEPPAKPGTAPSPLSQPPQNLLEIDDIDQLFQLPENAGGGSQPAVPLAFAEPGARVFTKPAQPTGSRSQSSIGSSSKPETTSSTTSGSQSRLSTNLLLLVIGAALALLLLGFMAGLIVGRFVWLK
jgi:phage FluMu protein Com